VGIALGLAAALSWGLADYFAALASRRTGALQVVLGFHLVATALLALAVFGTGDDLSDVGRSDFGWFVFVGALGWLSYLAFYRALAIGPISIVSPIVSAYAAVTVICAVLIGGESLAAGEALAVAVVLSGVLLASSDLRQMRAIERLAAVGLVLALLTAVLIGAFVYGVAFFTDEYGWLVPIFLARAISTLFVLGTAIQAGQWRLPLAPRSLVLMIVFIAVVDTVGYVAFNFGVRHADTTIVATAAAPYSVVPIALGVLLLHERPVRVQWIGVGLVIAGLVVLGLVA
jgi:drug/metabolite transporter (DMT)-like permease